jgi:hypothetical protein
MDGACDANHIDCYVSIISLDYRDYYYKSQSYHGTLTFMAVEEFNTAWE